MLGGTVVCVVHGLARLHREAPTSKPERQVAFSSRLLKYPSTQGPSSQEIPLNLTAAVHARRSIKEFTSKPIAREAIEPLLDAAAQAPNHRLTQPWRFYVLGPEARRAFGEALGRRKTKRVEDPAAAAAVVAKVADAHAALPALLVVATTLDENPEIREEDYAATMMAVQNLCLAAHDAGLGTHIKSGAVMDDPAARAASA
jgi:nitroreductase